ncbi:MAG: hypothetical protein IKD45_04855 [Clostridia bacterium]|nr:hypothetical protein [Clostridia bacterium]
MKKERERKSKKESIRYFRDYNEDFGDMSLEEKIIDKDYSYNYERRGYPILHAILYRGIATPLAFIYSRIIKRERFFGKEKLSSVEGGFFVFANHTQPIGDALSTNIFLFPRAADTVISSKNLSMPVIGEALPYLGGIPTPTELSAMRSFRATIDESIRRRHGVIIFPEGHLWEGMTSLRPFGSESFTYPARLGAPAFALTRVYRSHRGSYRCELHLDGPFYPDMSLSVSECRDKLCSEVRAAMEARCAESDATPCRYVKIK